jgi:hypothetical protein
MPGAAIIDSFPSVAEVERIAALGNPVMRNLWITQCYHELSAALTRQTGLSANWCTFATWASRQAGQTIRKEDLRRALENRLATAATTTRAAENAAALGRNFGGAHEPQKTRSLVLQALNPASSIERASDAVGRGNKKVFEEIGYEFARFITTCLNDTAFNEITITQFCDGLRPGDPPDGQRYLRQAFRRYYQAFFESDPKVRAELLLAANLEIGFHEQTRLQPEIAESMNVAFDDPDHVMRRLLSAIFPFYGWLIYVLLLALRRVLRRPTLFEMAVIALVAEARQEARLLITGHLMTIGLPHGMQVRLGEDLRLGFPTSLLHISNPDLSTLLEQIDPTPDSTTDSGASDWANFPERLHFIADLFRCYQESPDVFEPPFTAEQVAALKAGRMPEGAL